jgi:hypothetical protein
MHTTPALHLKPVTHENGVMGNSILPNSGGSEEDAHRMNSLQAQWLHAPAGAVSSGSMAEWPQRRDGRAERYPQRVTEPGVEVRRCIP